jgi:acid phosphatase type 7
VCQYALHEDKQFTEAVGVSSKFVDGGSEKRVQYIHKVLLRNLTPLKSYHYRCGSQLGWSPEFFFRLPSDQPTATVRLGIFGDMGNENAQSLAYLQQETQDGSFDALIHVGDFAYDMHTDQARVGDEFMNQIQSVAAYAPYMVCPGNHEEG